MKKLTLFTVALVALAACSKQDEITPVNNPKWGGDVVVNDFRLNDQDVIERARRAVRQMNTRTSNAQIKDIAVILRSDIQPASRASGNDTIMYSVNFANDNGFVLMSTDKRVPVIAIAEKGNFYGRTDNPGLKIFLERSEAYIRQTIAQQEAYMDSIANEPIDSEITYDNSAPLSNSLSTKIRIMEYYTKIDGKIPPMPPFPDAEFAGYFEIVWGSAIIDSRDPVIKVTWDQSMPPYNSFFDYCVMSTLQREPAGCSTTALAQIFSHFEQPKQIEDPRSPRVMRTLNWTNMKKTPTAIGISNPEDKERLGLLFRVIANKIQTHERCDYTWALPSDVESGLKSLRYSSDSWRNYMYDGAIGSIKAGRPVMMVGWSCDLLSSHYWVLDGYRVDRSDREKYEVWYTNRVSGGIYSRLIKAIPGLPHHYIFCNWGYNGRYNGYYTQGVWDEGNKPTLPASAPSTKVKYEKNVLMLTNIRY